MTPAKAWRAGLAWAALVVTVGLLMFTYRHLEDVTTGGDEDFRRPLINELSAALGAGLLFWGVRALTLRWPLARLGWRRGLPLYGAALLAFSAAHTSFNWGARELLYRLFGLGDYDYGRMPLRYAMELPSDVLVFGLMVTGLVTAERLSAARERELEAARLERSLAQAQLAKLRLQLQPHFLFNALHAVSATLYERPAAADEMLGQLAELLRRALAAAATDEVPLAEELEGLEVYLALQRARFGERLAVSLEVDPAARAVAVPFLLLQPLVENAIRHGGLERTGHGRIQLAARPVADQLELVVEDDGAPAPTATDGHGLGLGATAERLRLLYGTAQSLEAGPRTGGGFRVRVTLPWRTTEAPRR